ncbi:HD domain-containing phosphohydrolase [Rhodocyclus gracilis]
MARRIEFRFQSMVLATMALFVLLLTAAFLATVLGKFATMAEDNAKEHFRQVAQHAAAEISGRISGVSRFVNIEANSTVSLFARDGKLNTRDLLPTFIASLAGDDRLYGHFFALGDDDFLQVIGVHGIPRIVSALKAPATTQFAVRHIERVRGERIERWQFLDAGRKVIATRNAPASYLPSSRPWFAGAMMNGRPSLTAPYVFESSEVFGVTVSAPLPGGIGVVATDIDLGSLGDFLAGLSLSPNAAILMLDPRGRVLAFSGHGERFAKARVAAMSPLNAVEEPLLRELAPLLSGEGAQVVRLGTAGAEEDYIATVQTTTPITGSTFSVVALAPVSDFNTPIARARHDVLLVSALTLLILVPLSLLGSRQVGGALVALARNSERLKQLDFSTSLAHPDSILYEVNALSDAQQVMQQSIRERTTELNLAREKLARLVANGLRLSREQDRDTLLGHILHGGRDIANCVAGTLYLMTEHDTLRFALRTHSDPLPEHELPLHDAATGAPMNGYVASYVALNNKTVVIDDVYTEERFDLSGTRRFSEESGFRVISMLTVPLSPRAGEVIGVMQLMNALDPETGEVIPFSTELVSFIEALAAQSAVTLENHHLLEAQKNLMDSMIMIIAGAIDAKSPYTGGHCERVPELAVMLAEEAGKVSGGPLADFRFQSEDEWREFRIGAWLHDCGKVTTPEYVVDKATKLETIYNRIHELRARFEILFRDAEIARLEAIAAGVPAADAAALCAERQHQLREDFAFVAECNIGSETMAPENIARLQQIASQTWVRHFDDRLGLSHGELVRIEHFPATPLPATERLIADQPWHCIPRDASNSLTSGHGFRVDVPPYLYNFGELYNLCITRGTLTEEERFKINEHIIQTIRMLDQLPFPKQLKRVPEYAGTHHETLVGNGYPRQLTHAELSIPARIMAIADIFEALTASDRPYKKAKTLSEAVKILARLKDQQHIDPALFELFLRTGIFQRYGERFLQPEQLDTVDVEAYLGRA